MINCYNDTAILQIPTVRSLPDNRFWSVSEQNCLHAPRMCGFLLFLFLSQPCGLKVVNCLCAGVCDGDQGNASASPLHPQNHASYHCDRLWRGVQENRLLAQRHGWESASQTGLTSLSKRRFIKILHYLALILKPYLIYCVPPQKTIDSRVPMKKISSSKWFL